MKSNVFGNSIVWTEKPILIASLIIGAEALLLLALWAIIQTPSQHRSQDESRPADQTSVSRIQPSSEPAQQTPPGTEGPKIATASRNDRHAWWTERTGTWIGAIGGSVVGCLGGLIGTLGGLGLARRFVLTLTAALIVVGVVSLGAGVVALVIGQPYAVFYPLLLGGIILTAVAGPNFFVLRQAYQQRELHKMAAMDACHICPDSETKESKDQPE